MYIGVSDTSPVDVTPALNNYKQCVYYEGTVGEGETKTFQCTGHGGVMGRYLIVQVATNEPLTLCEVEVEEGEGKKTKR